MTVGEMLPDELFSTAVESVTRIDSKYLGKTDLEQVRYVTIVSRPDDQVGHSAVSLNVLTQCQSLRVPNILLIDADHLTTLRDLKELTLWRTDASQSKQWQMMDQLRYLRLRDLGLDSLSNPLVENAANVTYLDIRNNNIESLEPLRSLPALEILDVRGNPISADEIAAFKRIRPGVMIYQGPWPSPDQYVQRYWCSVWQKCEAECSLTVVGERGDDNSSDSLPWIAEGERGLVRLNEAGETDYYSGFGAVIVRFATCKLAMGDASYVFDPEDAYFNWFLRHTAMPPSNDALYTLHHTVEWIEKNSNSEVLPPAILLDDMIAAWKSLVAGPEGEGT